MPKTLADIKIGIQRRVKDEIDNQEIIDWCNDAQSELMLVIEVPDTAQIVINTTDLVYTEPAGTKRINRLWLQSDRDRGTDKEWPYPFRRYNGKLIFETRFPRVDTLNVDFYRNLTYFENTSEVIDLDDRYEALYTSYGIAQYYDSPRAVERLGEAQAKRQYDKHFIRHMGIREQIATQFVMQAQPSTIKEGW